MTLIEHKALAVMRSASNLLKAESVPWRGDRLDFPGILRVQTLEIASSFYRKLEFRAIAAVFAEPQRRLGRHECAFCKDSMEGLPTYS